MKSKSCIRNVKTWNVIKEGSQCNSQWVGIKLLLEEMRNWTSNYCFFYWQRCQQSLSIENEFLLPKQKFIRIFVFCSPAWTTHHLHLCGSHYYTQLWRTNYSKYQFCTEKHFRVEGLHFKMIQNLPPAKKNLTW